VTRTIFRLLHTMIHGCPRQRLHTVSSVFVHGASAGMRSNSRCAFSTLSFVCGDRFFSVAIWLPNVAYALQCPARCKCCVHSRLFKQGGRSRRAMAGHCVSPSLITIGDVFGGGGGGGAPPPRDQGSNVLIVNPPQGGEVSAMA